MSTENSFETLSVSLDGLAEKLLSGRRRIYTEIEPNSIENVKKIIDDALPIHRRNVADIKYLLNYYLGIHQICARTTDYTSIANNKVVINYAQSIVRDVVGYTFGEPIEYVQKKLEKADSVEELSSILQEAEMPLEDLITATYCSICGIGYQCVLPSKDYKDDPELGIQVGHLSPLSTFAVQSCEFKNPYVLTATYYISPETGKEVITAYANGHTYKYEEDTIIDSGENHIKGNPITVFENNSFLTGDFETVISMLDALNQVSSDNVNDIQNFVQSLLVFINGSLGETDEEREATKKLIKQNRMIELKSPQNVQADAKYITQQLNPSSTQTLRDYLEEGLWKVVGVPDRKTRSGGGGDTGDAVALRDGWADIEVVARNKVQFFGKAKKEEIKVALYLLERIDKIKDLSVRDIDIKFRRNKNNNIGTKSQAFSTLVATQVLDPRDALSMADITSDVNKVIQRGEEYWNNKEQQFNAGDNTNGEEDVKEDKMSSMRETTVENSRQ